MADSTLSNLTSLTLPSQATDLLLVGRGTARPNKVAMSDALNSAALAATTSTYGVAQLAADGGTTAGTVVQATDARLSDTRNPPDGSKGDIVVSGSGSTWTIKTNPTLSGNVTATGWIKTADGTAAAPAYAFSSEAGLGFYRVASTGVGFGTQSVLSLAFYPGGEIYGAQGSNRISLTAGGAILLSASSSNQPITLTPSGAATGGGLSLTRLTSTSQTLALLNYGTDELMSIVGTGYTGVGSRSNTPFILYSNNTERARFLAGGNFLIGATIDSSNGRLQLADHTAATGGIGMGTDWSFFRLNTSILRFQTASVSPGLSLRHSTSGTELTLTASTASGNGIVNTVSCNNLVLGVNGGTALTIDNAQGATFAKDIFLGTSGPSVSSTLTARASEQGLVFDGTASTSASATIGSLGTSPLTYEASFRVPLASGTGQGVMYVGTSPSSVGGNSGAVYLEASGTLRVIFRTDNSNYSIADIGSFQQANAGKFVHFALVRPSSGNAIIYINGVAQSPVFSVVGAPAGGWQMNLTGTNAVLNLTDGSATAGTTILAPRIYNRALSAAEIKSLFESGVPAAADYNTAGTTLNTANFSDVGGGSTLSGNSPTGVTVVRASASSYIAVQSGGKNARPGQRFRLTGTLTLNAGKTVIPVAYVDGTSSTQVPLTAGAFSVEIVTPASGGTTAGIVLAGFGDQNWTVSGFSAISLGAVLAPDAAQTGGGLTWYDTSGNAANLALSASGVAWNVPTSGNVTSSSDLFFRAGGTSKNLYLIPSSGGDVRIVGGSFSTLRFYDGSTQKGALFFSNADNAFEYNDGTSTSVKLYTGAPADSLVLSSSGFLLLGVSNPGNANGRLQLATHTAITGGIGFGTDVNLFRSPSSQLRFSKGGGYAIFEVQGPTGSYVDFYASNGTTRNGSVGTEQVGTMFVGTRVSADTVLMTNGTAALTINSSQNSVFAGNIAAQGSVASDGVNGNALFGGAKRVIIGFDTTADIGNIAAVHTGTAWKALALQPVSGAVLIGKTSDTGNGRLQFAESTSAQNGIQFGTDTNLYRSAANTLKTDDNFQAAQGLVSGTYLGGQDLYLNNAAGTVRAVYWQSAGSSRWAMYANTAAESGSNAGTNWVLSRYSDAGAYLGDPLAINRATGAVSLEGNLSLTNTATQVIFGQTGAAYTYTIRPIQAGGAIQIKQDPATINRWLALGGSDNSGNFSERMRIVNAGNILFGTTVDSGALLQVGTNTTAASGGMIFGTDVTLYRSAANVLRTDDSFEALNNADTYLQVGAAAPYQRAAIGLTRRLNYGDVLFARNLQGQSGTDSYTAIGTDTGSGYAGFEAQYGGVARILLGTGATTANAVVTPTVALSASTSAVSIPLSTVSNSTSSGALVVSGGLGVAGAGNFGGTVGVGGATVASRLHVYESTSGTGDSNGITIEQAGTADAALQFLLTGVQRWTVGIDNSDSDKFKIGTGAIGSAERLTIDTSGNIVTGGSVQTSAPTGGTAAAWKLGTVATVSPTSPNRTIEVDIGGTIYYIHAKTTNN